ncbi:MAG: Unknown protein [uncultured Thiotrichaceae bacterium]|uniref:Uncharacterized protein n=1 Tax=uncultured Thiotrichaceae bacterium TaxID=298394 RepID=A0A6S6UDH1_9GAMM|nr:MAG: Unknown protein [uncultured Thiotrichaceae bacterium]
MAVGASGRIVIEISPDLKQALYEQLNQDNLNLKQWFLGHVDEFLENKTQLNLSFTPSSKDDQIKELVEAK